MKHVGMERMRIVLDLQACQSNSRFRGIGRYALALGKAMARLRGDHELVIALNGGIAGTIEPIRAEFDGLVDQSDIRTWSMPLPTAALDAANQWRTRIGEHVREAFLASLRPDVLHVGSMFEGLADNSVTSIGVDPHLARRTAVTFYDLIPLQYPDQYLGDKRIRDWYQPKLEQLKKAGQLLAISDSSRREAIDLLGIQAERVVAISSGVDELFRPRQLAPAAMAELRARFGITRSSVLYTGGVDPRKNVPSLVAAFARLPESLRRAHQLVVVGNLDAREREVLGAVASRFGMEADELVITGYVPDADLLALYNLSELFVFPSLHEGFGLPALEAMACGLPVIASDRSSLPEAIGRRDALFDPTSVDAIAAKMTHALTDAEFRADLRSHGLARSALFTWDSCARRAIAAMEQLHVARLGEAGKKEGYQGTEGRRKLAVVTPLPPERTGIADYSVALMPHLARHYDVEVVTGPSECARPATLSGLPVRSSQWFQEHAGGFDRILYHFGNSPFHTFMLDLLQDHPGTVVMHDFFLSDLSAYLELSGERSGFWTRALYDSHGYPALVDRARDQERPDGVTTKYQFPSNASVLGLADGIIAHSAHSRDLARKWYGPRLPADWHVVPFLRELPTMGGRAAAREQLGLDPDDFIVCSFGMLAPTKLNHRLLSAWLASSLATDPACRLVFVGENDGGAYGLQLTDSIKTAGRGAVSITGHVTPDMYRAYLDAADACVQLRTLSRGETSAAVFDALAHGLPTILNANGAMVEIHPDAAVVLPDGFTDAALTGALESLRKDFDARRALGERARSHVGERHDPARVAARYHDAIESDAELGPKSSIARVVARLAAVDLDAVDADLPRLAACLARNHRMAFPARQLFLDISILVREDLKTGIERVVRGVLLALLEETFDGYRIEPVYADDQCVYRYARRFCARLAGAEPAHLDDDPLEYSPGDIYLALDLTLQNVPRDRAFLEEMRDSGVGLYFVMYDLLPMRRPDFFPEWLHPVFSAWLDTVSVLADGVLCISKAVANDLAVELRRLHPLRLRPLQIASFKLGSDLQASSPTRGMDPADATFLRGMSGRACFLMVGTVEPRKGHKQALDAFDALWGLGSDACLVIVGKPGWMIESVVERLRGHREMGRRLFWFPKASDELLEALYRTATALLMASKGEGYGLPLIEAAHHGLPIVCRDLPVFREVAGEHAFYFSGDDGESLAAAIKQWRSLAASGEAPDSRGIRGVTWRESARDLVGTLLDGRWHARWMPDGRRWYPANDSRLHTEVGELKRSHYVTRGREGYLVYGPYQRFAAGAYRLRVFGHRLDSARAGRIVIDVNHDHARQSVLQFEVPDIGGATMLAEVDFVLPAEVADLEVRLWVDDSAEVEFSGFEIDRVAGGAVRTYHAHSAMLSDEAGVVLPAES